MWEFIKKCQDGGGGSGVSELSLGWEGRYLNPISHDGAHNGVMGGGKPWYVPIKYGS
jgi:hypothetical protein